MWDNDDFDFALLALPWGPCWPIWLACLAILIAVGLLVMRDSDACADRCAGSGRVIEGICYCVEKDRSLREPPE